MAKKVFNMAGGMHSAAALSAFIDEMFGTCVAKGLNVVPTGANGLNVVVKAGTGNISTGQRFGRLIQIDADETVALSPASASYARIDTIVGYIDSAVQPTTAVVDNTNDILKFKAITGTPAANPQAPSSAQIQSSIKAGNPYIALANVTVPKSATSIIAGNIADIGNKFLPINGSDIANGSINSNHIDLDNFNYVKYSNTSTLVGKWIDGRKVYRRVITGTGNVPASIPFEKFTTIVKAEMMVKNQGAGQAWRMIPWLFNGNDLNWYGGYYFLEDNRTIAVQLGNEISKAVYWHIIVEYCKD